MTPDASPWSWWLSAHNAPADSRCPKVRWALEDDAIIESRTRLPTMDQVPLFPCYQPGAFMLPRHRRALGWEGRVRTVRNCPAFCNGPSIFPGLQLQGGGGTWSIFGPGEEKEETSKRVEDGLVINCSTAW